MIEQVKVMVDEQTKRTLVQLQNAFAELLAPLGKLDALGGAGDAQGVSTQLSSEIRKIANAVEDATDDLKRRIAEIADNQAELFGKFAQLVSNQETMLRKLDALTGGGQKDQPKSEPVSDSKAKVSTPKAPKATAKVKPTVKAKAVKPVVKAKSVKAKTAAKGRKR